MEFSNLQERYSPLLRQYWLPLSLGFLGLIFLGYGLIGYLFPKKDKPDILFEAASTSSISNDTTMGSAVKAQPQKLITVDVEGAVQKPGIYKLPADSRVQDALIAAEGMGEDADRARIAKTLNLAAKLTDGGKVYIAFVGDSTITRFFIMS